MRAFSLMVFVGTFFSLKTYSSERDNSQELAEEYMNECILDGLESAAENNYWINADEVIKACACFANNKVQGLNVEACEDVTPIRDSDVKKIFK